MELKINYQYTYFIYPFAIKTEKYKRYILGLLKNEKYELQFFDGFKDVDLYNYFIPSIKENIFQDFTFSKEKIATFYKLSSSNQYKELLKQNCLMFNYQMEEMQGKTEEKDGIFFQIQKIQLVCFKTGICFLLLKTHIEETDKFSDLLNFNYKFGNIHLETKSLKKLNRIKIQTDAFSSMNYLSEMIHEITGQKIKSKELEIDENLFLTYGYACIDSSFWNKDEDFQNIQNEFVKFSNLYPSNTNVNVDYEKLTMFTNTSYMKLRMNSKGSFLICSSTDSHNYTNLPHLYERQYLYTYIMALHQRYYLKKISKELGKKQGKRKALKQFIEFTKEIWINEVTMESLGQKMYQRCKETMNLDTLYQEAKSKYDVFYKEKNIERSNRISCITIVLVMIAIILALENLATILFYNT